MNIFIVCGIQMRHGTIDPLFLYKLVYCVPFLYYYCFTYLVHCGPCTCFSIIDSNMVQTNILRDLSISKVAANDEL